MYKNVALMLVSGVLFTMGLFAQGKTAVIVVDLQSDFTVAKNGSLAVAGSDAAYLKAVVDATLALKAEGYPVYATQDWHPLNHTSFASNHPGAKVYDTLALNGKTQVLWPNHCVQGSDGAKILLDNNIFQAIVKKGQNPKYDSYSGFQDDGGDYTELATILKAAGITKLVVYGLATDYCVQATAVDAQAAGFTVVVIEGLSKGVAPETTAKALGNLKAKGITVLPSLDISLIKKL